MASDELADLTDRSQDVSQPVDRLGIDEKIKAESDYLRGTIDTALLDQITDSVSFEDGKLMKFHGVYQQDDRDVRDDRRRRKLEPDYRFMVRVRLPAGVCTTQQWLTMDQLARDHGRAMLRLTTRQTFQFHWILKDKLKDTIAGMHAVLLDTIAACGDDARTVMCTANPDDGAIHAELAALTKAMSDHVIPRTRAYHEIWYGEQRVASSAPQEPFYGPTYLPRKFKIGIALPPSNDIDIYTQCLGFVAIVEGGQLSGFNLVVGGGMGRSDSDPDTFARLGEVAGYVDKADLIAATDAVMGIQRDFGNRAIRARARFKYTVHDKGLAFIQAEIARRMGKTLHPARPFIFANNGDRYGWVEVSPGVWNYTFFIEAGRILNRTGHTLLDALRELAEVHPGTFRLTPNQNLTIAGVADADKAAVAQLFARHGLGEANAISPLKQLSMPCVALPTCPLAMAEAERYLPELVGKIDLRLARHGLGELPITIRMTGCPNGCARPYVAEIALTGRAPGKYNLWLGGSPKGDRLALLARENIGEAAILDELDGLFERYAAERQSDESFGDFAHRRVQA